MDGYHELETIMLPVPLYDVLEILPSETFQFHLTGKEIPGDSNENICVKAFHLFEEAFSIPPVSIHLHKMLPTGAGMGAGSANGAFVLKGLNTLFSLGLSDQELIYWSAKLGSDCAFFIKNIPQIASGRGELLKDINIDLSGFFLVLEHLPIHISTAEAFKGVHLSQRDPALTEWVTQPVLKWKSFLQNDFEKHIFEHYPELKKKKEELYQAGALFASMTGSGSVIYGIFEKRPMGYKISVEL